MPFVDTETTVPFSKDPRVYVHQVTVSEFGAKAEKIYYGLIRVELKFDFASGKLIWGTNEDQIKKMFIALLFKMKNTFL